MTNTQEEKLQLEISGGFYNPKMRFCRSISSLCIGALGGKPAVLDAFSASGVRGLRYAKENRNVKKLTLLDYSPNAEKLMKKNAKANKVKAEVVRSEVCRYLIGEPEERFDFIELDPFGTPAPYLNDAIRKLSASKTSYLSTTATDMAVLCGPERRACMKNYHSRSLNNEFTHETGARILLKRIAETAMEHNLGMTPVLTLSKDHYIKVVVRLERNAKKAEETAKMMRFVMYDAKSGERGASELPDLCGGAGVSVIGPLWGGELHDPTVLEKMEKLNAGRGYADKEELAKTTSLMRNELGFAPYFFDVHGAAKVAGKGRIPPMQEVMEGLRARGFGAERTHFSPTGIKTDACMKDITALL